MVSLKITVKEIENSFSDRIYARGEDYYNRDFVSQLRVSGRMIYATVKGSYYPYYKVRISLKSKGFEGGCTYPYDGYCKHLAAVLLEYINEYQNKGEEGGKQAEIEKWLTSFQEVDLEKIRGEVKSNHLLAFLEEYSKQYPSFGLLLAIKFNVGKDSLTDLRKLFKIRIHEFFENTFPDEVNGQQESIENDEDYYEDENDYYENFNYLEENINNSLSLSEAEMLKLDNILREIMISPSNLGIELIEEVVDNFLKVTANKTYQETLILDHLDIFQKTLDLLQHRSKVLTSEANRRSLVQRMFTRVNTLLIPEEILQKVLDFFVAFATLPNDFQYIHTRLTERLKQRNTENKLIHETMAKLELKKGNIKAYISIKEKNFRYEEDYLELAEVFSKTENLEEYKKIMLKGFYQLLPSEHSTIFRGLSTFYIETGQNEKLLEIMKSRFSRHFPLDPELFVGIKKLAKKLEKWEETRKLLVKELKKKKIT